MLRLLLLTAALVMNSGADALEPDWSAYGEVLNDVYQGTKNGVDLALVDYQALKDNGKLQVVYRQLKSFPVSSLNSREEKLAFYINSYNILALKMVLDHWPVKSIKDVGGFFHPVWDKAAGEIDAKTVTLGDIEHKILRPMGEPRIHFAIVCASVSCPDLRNEPYTASKLDEQLNEQVKRFLSNDRKGLRVGKKYIYISKIFDWFEDDFQVAGGVKNFIGKYRPDLSVLPIKDNINYDWEVNGIISNK